MASTSAPRSSAAYGRIASATSTLCSDNQTLIAEIRKATMMMKEIAVDLERENKSEMVKELEDGVLELLKASDECTHLSNAIKCIGNEYQPGPELTNFRKLFADKIERLKADPSSVSQNQLLLRQFREAIWNVHHAGQPMPGEEQEDIVMTSTECNLLNISCPLTGKPVTELADPVRSMDCKHIYEKKAIMQHIRSKVSQGRCPVTGCPKKLVADRVVCDALLLIEIDEMRSISKQRTGANVIEDFTQLDEED
ncbi:E3 SUMO-protein ligase MMS21 [Sesamum alatum]|uniref:E3 SUMO-protein ligase MMS21 n=1 Tax=Sesamum alatum TaxID=300844 RepID=A0AAE2CYY4_9LAMI|nr:E3 SUMO-protein ligase MMS21 [Sesamum alatum]